MYRLIGAMLIVLGVAGAMFAQLPKGPAPEIDPSSAASALTLLTGALFVIRGARKK